MRRWAEDIVNHSSDGVVSLDHDYVIRAFNPSAERIFGYRPDEVIGQPLTILLPKQWRAEHDKLFHSFIQGSETSLRMTSRSTVIGLRKDGVETPLQISIVKHEDSSQFSVSAICRDVASIEDLKQELELARLRLDRTQCIAKLGYWDWNDPFKRLSWSNEVYQILGVEDNTGASLQTLMRLIVPEDRRRVAGEIRKSIQTKSSYSVIYRIKTPSGLDKVLEHTGQIVRSKSGRPSGMEGVIQDITQYWTLKDSLTELAQRARIAEQTQSQFLAIMSHELRTPLNAVSGFTELLMEELKTEGSTRLRHYGKEIYQGSSKLLQLINDILKYSRMTADGIEPSPRRFNPYRFIEDTVREADAAAQERNVTIKIAIPGDIPDLLLDEILCRQILTNLPSNAIKFSSENGSIVVGLEKREHEVDFFVKDNGIGMSDEELQHIFDPFQQGRMDLSRAYEGIGLGLTIAKNMTEIQEGHIAVRSEPGHGSLFTVTFPQNFSKQKCAPAYDVTTKSA